MVIKEKTKLQIIDLLDKGISTNKIARLLNINVKTVYKYSKNKEVKNVGSKKNIKPNKKAGGSGGDQLKPGDKDIKEERSVNNKDKNEDTSNGENEKIEFVGGSDMAKKEETPDKEEEEYLCPNCGATFKGKKEECPGCGVGLECD